MQAAAGRRRGPKSAQALLRRAYGLLRGSPVPLGGAGEPLVLAGALDDRVTVAEANVCARLAPLVPQIGNPLFEVLMLCCQPRIVAAGQLAHDLRPAYGEPVDLPFYLDQRWHTPENASAPSYIPANCCGETSTPKSHQKAGESSPAPPGLERRPHLQELDA